MGKKSIRILLAVDDSKDSEIAVQYTTMMTSGIPEVHYTLFALESWIPDILTKGGKADFEAKEQVDRLTQENREDATRLVRRLKDRMVKDGVQESHIETVAQPIDLGIAKDIVNRAEKASHDAIVIARRGLTPAKDFFIGTIASKLVEHALEIPVWITDKEIGSRTVLIPVDGSSNSLKIVRYVFHVLGALPDAKVTLFHVVPHLRHYFSIPFEKEYPYLQGVLQREDRQRMAELEKNVSALLKKTNNLQVDIQSKTNSYDISTAILDEARTGRYGTLVVGRRGERQAFFAGRVPLRLAQKITGPALWVVP